MAKKTQLKSLNNIFKDILKENNLAQKDKLEINYKLMFYLGFSECLNTLRNTGNADEEVLGAYVDELEQELNQFITKI